MTTAYPAALRRLLEARAVPSGDDQLSRFLYTQIPKFTAPANPRTWPREAAALRRAALDRVYLRGYPASVVAGRPRVVWGETLRPDRAYVIRTLRYEAYPDYWIPGLMYEPARLRGRVPVVLNPNGHHRGGKAADYKQIRCANLARRGVIALSMEFIGMSELEADCFHNNAAYLDVTGLAGVGLFYLALQKGLDVLLAHRHADPKRVCVTGLSGGGWQTIVLSALDPRVTMSVPVAGYTPMRVRIGEPSDRGDHEQMPPDLTTVLDYDTMTAMLAPRPALVILNEKDDCCFQTARTRPVIYDAVRPTYAAMGAADRFATHNNTDPGTHNYDADNRSQFYRFLNRHFGLDAPVADIHRDDELYSEAELKVGLPPCQTTLARIAWERMRDLASRLPLPCTPADKRRLRRRLADVIRLPGYGPAAARLARRSGRNALYTVRAGPWSLPLAVAPGARGEEPVLIISQAGRATHPPMPIAQEGTRYLADILGTGELAPPNSLLQILESAGHRVLGIQVAQVLTLARLVAKREGGRPVHLVGDGWQTCFVLLVACALEPGLFASYTPYMPLETLCYVVDWPLRAEEARSMLCFGLMEVADVPQLRALMRGVEYRTPGRNTPPDRRR